MLFLASCSEGFVRKLGGGRNSQHGIGGVGGRARTGPASAGSRTQQICLIYRLVLSLSHTGGSCFAPCFRLNLRPVEFLHICGLDAC